MNVKEIITKASKGEALNDEERAALAGFDPDIVVNSAAAAARKKAEAEAAVTASQLVTLQQKLDAAEQAVAAKAGASQSEQQKAQAKLDGLEKQMADLTKALEGERGEKVKLVRQSKLDGLLRQANITFIEQVDKGIMTGAFQRAFDAMTEEDLSDESKVKPVLETFRAVNAGVILDLTGSGSGTRPAATGPLGINGKPVDKMSADERKADLKKRGIL